jgi:hypothetical protein
MLRTPDGQLPVDLDLALQNALDSRAKTLFGRRPAGLINEREIDGVRHIAEEFKDVDHCPIIERDVALIALARRIELGPASRGIPGAKDMIKTFLERVLVVLIPGGAVQPCEESQLAKSRSVVECPLEQAPVTGVGPSGGVNVLRPAPLIIW